ncbi:MAG TPA: geranylgeranyl reductase family protein [Thermomicrobiaceae bacterium]|nr:geranylgeranyl reductase family protein [Thermomicrobiaceae bacterium]
MTGHRYDALVVGGGPAGAAVARDVAGAGFTVAVLERDERIGYPVQCSGLVTRRTLERAGLDPNLALNPLFGATVHSPSGERYELGGDRIHAYVMDRSRFDEAIMAQALEAGVELWTGTQVTRLVRRPGGVTIEARRGGCGVHFEARLVIGADGPRSVVASFLGLPEPAEFLRARGADVRLPRPQPRDEVQLFAGARYGPGFFAWAIPLGDSRFRIGWGSSRGGSGTAYLRALVSDHPQVFAGMEILSQTGGLIPLGPRPVTVGDHGLVVGDAAGQAKPTSGGGLYTSLVCAAHCAAAAVDALRADDTSSARLAAYDTRWRADLGGELDRAAALRQVYRELSDEDLDWGLRWLQVPGIRLIVDRFGDIDYPSRLALVALRAAPRLTRLLRRRPELIPALQTPATSQAFADGG